MAKKIDREPKAVIHAECGKPVCFVQLYLGHQDVLLGYPFRPLDGLLSRKPNFMSCGPMTEPLMTEDDAKDTRGIYCYTCKRLLRVLKASEAVEALPELFREGVLKTI